MCGPSETICMTEDLDDQNQDYKVFGDEDEGLKDEKQFVFQFETGVNGLLKSMKDFQT